MVGGTPDAPLPYPGPHGPGPSNPSPMALARAAGAGKEHAVLAYLVTEPELAVDGPLDDTLDLAPDDGPLLAALAYEAAPDSADRRWIPARRRPTASMAVPVA